MYRYMPCRYPLNDDKIIDWTNLFNRTFNGRTKGSINLRQQHIGENEANLEGENLY